MSNRVSLRMILYYVLSGNIHVNMSIFLSNCGKILTNIFSWIVLFVLLVNTKCFCNFAKTFLFKLLDLAKQVNNIGDVNIWMLNEFKRHFFCFSLPFNRNFRYVTFCNRGDAWTRVTHSADKSNKMLFLFPYSSKN